MQLFHCDDVLLTATKRPLKSSNTMMWFTWSLKNYLGCFQVSHDLFLRANADYACWIELVIFSFTESYPCWLDKCLTSTGYSSCFKALKTKTLLVSHGTMFNVRLSDYNQTIMDCFIYIYICITWCKSKLKGKMSENFKAKRYKLKVQCDFKRKGKQC